MNHFGTDSERVGGATLSHLQVHVRTGSVLYMPSATPP